MLRGGRQLAGERQRQRGVAESPTSGIEAIGVLNAAEAVFVIGREVREENAGLTWILARKDVAVLEADSRARRARPVVRTNGIRRAIEWASIQRRPPAVPAGVGHRVASGVTGAIRGAHALVANTGAIARSVQGVTHLTRRAGTRMAGGAAESVAAIAGLDAGTV
jgi:hypothetical protein